MEDLKVYQICDEDWVCARSQEEAVKWYLKEIGITQDGIYPLDMIVEADLDLNSMYTDEELTKEITFRKAVEQGVNEGIRTPYIICSYEC